MDQLVACCGQPGQALLIDCRTLERESVPLDQARARIVLCNTMVKHKLAGSEYNVRRAECEEAARLLGKRLSGILALRDVTLGEFNRYEHELPETIRRRARHVISENERVLTAVECLRRGDLKRFGVLMAESHRSLRDDYQVSCAELDLMVELANHVSGVYGARMTGGGFGGCTINLVAPEAVEAVCSTIARAYHQQTGLTPEIYIMEDTPSSR
jgi:galactokinase